MPFQKHQDKIYESLRDLLDIQPQCDYILSISPYHHQAKEGLFMGVTARLMTYLMGTIYVTQDRKQFLGMKAQVVHNRTMAIGPLYDEQNSQEGRGHFRLLLTDNGETKEHKLAWNDMDHDASSIFSIMFDFINKGSQ